MKPPRDEQHVLADSPATAAMHPRATNPMETPHQHCPPHTAVPQPWGHQQNPRKPNQPRELVYGIYSLGAFMGKNVLSIAGATVWWKTTFRHQSHVNCGLNTTAEACGAACILPPYHLPFATQLPQTAAEQAREQGPWKKTNQTLRLLEGSLGLLCEELLLVYTGCSNHYFSGRPCPA